MFPVELSGKFFNVFIVSRGTDNAQNLVIVDKKYCLGIILSLICNFLKISVEKITDFFIIFSNNPSQRLFCAIFVDKMRQNFVFAPFCRVEMLIKNRI